VSDCGPTVSLAWLGRTTPRHGEEVRNESTAVKIRTASPAIADAERLDIIHPTHDARTLCYLERCIPKIYAIKRVPFSRRISLFT